MHPLMFDLPHSAIVERFKATEAGRRFRGESDDHLWVGLSSAAMLAGALQANGLDERKQVSVLLINPSPLHLVDDGRWLLFAAALLGTGTKLSIEGRRHPGAPDLKIPSPLMRHVQPLPTIRVRTTDTAAPLHRAPDLIMLGGRCDLFAAAIHAPWTSAAPCVVSDVGAVCVQALHALLVEAGGEAREMRLRQDNDDPFGALFGLLIKRWPERPIAPDGVSIHERLMQFDGAFRDARKRSPEMGPRWPGKPASGLPHSAAYISPSMCVGTTDQPEPDSPGISYVHSPGCPQVPADADYPTREHLAFAIAVLRARGNTQRRVPFQELTSSLRELISAAGCVVPPRALQLVRSSGIFNAIDRLPPTALERDIAFGADLYQRNAAGLTPLLHALRIEHDEHAAILAATGEAVDVPDPNGMPPIIAALAFVMLAPTAHLLTFDEALAGTLPSGVPVAELTWDLLREIESKGWLAPEMMGAKSLDEFRRINDDFFARVERGPGSQADEATATDNSSSTDGPEFQPRPLSIDLQRAVRSALGVTTADPRDASTSTAPEFAVAPSALTHVAPRLPRVELVATLAATAGHRIPSGDIADLRQRALRAIAGWLREDKHLPDVDLSAPVQIEQPDAALTVEAGGAVWAMRFDDRSQVSTWRVEIVMVDHPPALATSLRLLCIAPPDDDRAPTPSVPRLVARLEAAVGLSDAGVPLLDSPWRIDTEYAWEGVLRLLENPARTQPVVVIPAGTSESEDLARAAAGRLAGFAHVALLNQAALLALGKTLGKEFVVFGQACRVFGPAFSREDDAQEHPLLARRDATERAFVARIVQTAARTAALGASEETVPTFAAARTIIAAMPTAEIQLELSVEIAQAPASTPDTETTPDEAPHTPPSARDTEGEPNPRAQDPALQAKLLALTAERDAWIQRFQERESEIQALRQDFEALRNDQREEIDRLRRAAYHLRTALEATRLAEANAAEVDVEVPLPSSLDQLERWSAEHLGSDVIIAAKALRAARKSSFADPPQVYRALLMLRDAYIPMRMDSSAERKAYFDDQCRALGLEVSPVGLAAEDHRYRASYRLSHRGREVKLDMHVKGNSSRDEKWGLRIYFAYLPEDGTVLIGHLPSHLQSSLSAC